MTQSTARKRIWGWFFFDWASQPFNTLILTFVFGPYIVELMGDGSAAQTAWTSGIGIGGLLIAFMAPVLGAMADSSGTRMFWIRVFSVAYVVGSFALWYAAPGDFSLWFILAMFILGMIGMEFTTIFTNALLPSLGSREDIGKISGYGWAFGYLGGLVALVLMLGFFAENAATGKTLFGTDPAFGLDAGLREGTRAVGPLTAIWFIIFMVPFFLWVREPAPKKAPAGAVRNALKDLRATLRRLPQTPSLFAYLGSSMLYRDSLNGMYALGGIYAAGVMGWSITQIGVFGIVSIIAGAVFAIVGGLADARFGPKPVITVCVWVLMAVGLGIAGTTPTQAIWVPVGAASPLPNLAFMFLGATIGAAGGALQSSSRSMMVRQSDPARSNEAFGLYALAGKATSFLAPALIAAFTGFSGSQQIGVLPLVVLFLLALVLLRWVDANGDPDACETEPS